MLTSENRNKLGIFSSSCPSIFTFFDPVSCLLGNCFDSKIIDFNYVKKKQTEVCQKVLFKQFLKIGKNMPLPPQVL